MIEPRWSGNSSRKIVKRIVIEGNLILLSPAHLGNGESSDFTDMPLLIDPVDEKTPLLTGTSIAGALRNVLMTNYGSSAPAELLLGSEKTETNGTQSRLIIDDAYGKPSGVEYRTNVRINPKSRTALQDGLFSTEFWCEGTNFDLRFELAIYESDDETQMKEYLALALSELEKDGSIALGAKKNSGFGVIDVKEWKAAQYGLLTINGLNNWLKNGQNTVTSDPVDDIYKLLDLKKPEKIYKELRINAHFQLDQSLLIHSGNDFEDSGADNVQLKTGVKGDLSVLPGTSWRGVLHNHARKIYAILNLGGYGKEHLESLFGHEAAENSDPVSGRIRILQSAVKGNMDLIQPRVSIDPFTGGVKAAALFFDQPVFAAIDSDLELTIQIKKPVKADLALCLLLLKDLWVGDIALGSESGIGRGRLKGISARISFPDEKNSSWEIKQDPKDRKKLIFDPADVSFLEDCVKNLEHDLQGGN
jgi:CRISPR/Cas system CSM-associated protein Csm3 (group 7 of RAMP superfamily)